MIMDVSPGAKLNNNQSTINYKSFGGLPQVKDVSPTKDFIWALQRNHGEDTAIMLPTEPAGLFPTPTTLQRCCCKSAPDLMS